MDTGEEVRQRRSWRRVLRRELSLFFLFKVAALVLLWWFFFSPSHRTAVDGVSTGERLALEHPAGGAANRAGAAPRPGERLD